MVVLTAVDGETARSHPLETGYRLAQQINHELLVLHVMPQEVFNAIRDESTDRDRDKSLVPYFGFVGEPASETDIENCDRPTPYKIENGENHAESIAREVVERTLNYPSDVRCLGRVGNPVQEIRDEAERKKVDYLVIGGRKRSAVGKVILGSSAQSVLLNSSNPVLTVSSNGAAGNLDFSSTAVVGVDDSNRAKIVLGTASQFAQQTGATLHVVHVNSRISNKQTGHNARPTSIQSIIDEADLELDDRHKAVELVGNPGERLIEYANDQDASCVITAGRRRSPVGKVLFGSVTQTVLLNSDRPVLTVVN